MSGWSMAKWGGGLRWMQGQSLTPIAYVDCNVTWVGCGNTLLTIRTAHFNCHPTLVALMTWYAFQKVPNMSEWSMAKWGGLMWMQGQPLWSTAGEDCNCT